MENIFIPVSPTTATVLLHMQRATGESFDEIICKLAANVVPARLTESPWEKSLGGERRHSAQELDDAPALETSPLRFQYTLVRRQYLVADATDAYCDILAKLSNRHQNFWPILGRQIRGRSRNHVGRTREEVYPERPDLAHHTREVIAGWFVGTNISGAEKRDILEAACQIVDLKFGIDLVICLPNR